MWMRAVTFVDGLVWMRRVDVASNVGDEKSWRLPCLWCFLRALRREATISEVNWPKLYVGWPARSVKFAVDICLYTHLHCLDVVACRVATWDQWILRLLQSLFLLFVETQQHGPLRKAAGNQVILWQELSANFSPCYCWWNKVAVMQRLAEVFNILKTR